MTVTNGNVTFSETIRMLYQQQRGSMVLNVFGFQTTITPPAYRLGDDNGARLMILHFPSAMDLNQKDNLLNGHLMPNALQDMQKAVTPNTPQSTLIPNSTAENQELYDHGIFKVFMINEPKGYLINRALLEYFEPENRPALVSPEVIHFYYWRFRHHKFVVCCFHVSEATRTTPLLIRYPSEEEGSYRIPGTLSVNGIHPDISGPIEETSTLVVSTNQMSSVKGGIKKVNYSDPIPDELSGWIPSHVVGKSFESEMMNHDWVIDLDGDTSVLQYERNLPKSITKPY